MGARGKETTAVTMRLPRDLVNQFDEFARNMGADRKTLVQMFMKKCVDNQKLPFDTSVSGDGAASGEGTASRDDLRRAIRSILAEDEAAGKLSGSLSRAFFEEDDE